MASSHHPETDGRVHTAFTREVADRFGVLPNFFRTASAAPSLIEELWAFAKAAYLDSPLPSLFKERLFVHLSRFCEVRYCIVRHAGFLVGAGRPAGDAAAPPQRVEEVVALLSRPLPGPEDLDAALGRLEAMPATAAIPAPDTQMETDLFDALTTLFLEPRHADRARAAVPHAVGEATYELLAAFLTFVRAAHYWTEAHPELAYEPDAVALLEQHPDLARLVLDRTEAEAANARGALRRAVAALDRAQDALHASEDRYRTLFETIDEGFSIFELIYDETGKAVDFRILEVNHTFERQTGLVDAVGKLASEIIPNTEPLWFEVFDHVQRTGEARRFENYHVATGRWYEVYASRIGGASGRLVCTVFDDITERKRAEELLRRAAERDAFRVELNDALRPLADPVRIQEEACRLLGEHLGVDRAYYVEANEAEGYTRVEREYARGDSPSLVGTYRVEDYGWTVPFLRRGETIIVADAETSDLVPEADRPAMRVVRIRAHVSVPLVKAGELVGALCVTEPAPRAWQEAEVELVRETAERIWAAIERARAEAALRASEERLRLATGAARISTFQIDVVTGTVEFDANVLAVLYGIESVEPGQGPHDWAALVQSWLRPEDALRHTALLRATMRGEGDLQNDLLVRDPATGVENWIEVRASLVRETASGPGRVIGIMHNITERKRAEAALHESEERLRLATEAARMYAWEFDLHTQTPRFSANASEITGYAHAAVFADNLALVHPDDRALVTDSLDEARRTGAGFDYEIRTMRSDERTAWLRVVGTVVRDAHGEPARAIGIAQDITARKAIEAALRASEERFRLAAEAVNAIIYDWDISTGRVERTRGLVEVLGYDEPDAGLVANAWLQFIHPDDRARAAAATGAALASDADRYTLEYRIRHRDGGYRDFWDHGLIVRDAAGRALRVVGSSIDITERKRLEAALHASEERFREFGEASSDVLWIRDAATLRFEYLSLAFAAIYGADRADVLGGDHVAAWAALIHPDDREHALANIARVRAGERVTHVFRIVRPADGHIRRVQNTDFPLRDEAGAVRRVAGIAQDVTEQFAAQEALRASQERLRAVANLVPDLLWESASDGTTTWYNDRWLEYTGQTFEQAIGWGWVDAIHPDDREASARHYREAAAAGASLRQEHRIRRHDGVYRWFVVNALPVKDTGGGVVRMYGAATDIHEERMARAEMERRVRAATAESRALSQRLLMVQEQERHNLARELHDEIGQSLTGLALTLAMARRAPPDGHLDRAATIADDLLRQVRDLSLDLRPSVLDDFGLLPAVRSLIERFTARTRMHIELHHEGTERRLPPAIETAAYRIVQEALTNVARHAGTNAATVHLLTDGALIVSVRDRGRGFDPDGRRAGAASSGLAGMRERAALAGGTVEIESAPGAGTTIIAEFPLDIPGEDDKSATTRGITDDDDRAGG
jgi:PAS domain S-box-containing protein